jgi:dCTP deaminase
MSFLNNTELAQLLPSCIDPFLPDRITSGAYELSMGNEFFTTNSDKKVKVKLKADEQFVIRPGQFALLVTSETIRIPETNLGFISIKAGVKFKGLINVSGFHVDPGFRGKLKFSVYNAGSRDILLTEGQRLFPLWLGEFTSALPANELYNGHFQNQDGITADDISRIEGKLFSPNVLSERIKELDSILNNIKIYATIITTLFIGIFIKYVLADIDNTKWQKLAEEQAGYNSRLARIDSLLTRTRAPLPAISKEADDSQLPIRIEPPRR